MIVKGYKIEPAASLTRAVLDGENLAGADLTAASLYRAELGGADLRGAILAKADLEGADLSGADLRGANLRGADLRRANLAGADLTGASLDSTAITAKQLASADGSGVPTLSRANKLGVRSFLAKIDFKIDVEVNETPENWDRIIARLDQLSADVANLAGISKKKTPAETVLAAIEASNLTQQILELVSDAVLDCAEME